MFEENYRRLKGEIAERKEMLENFEHTAEWLSVENLKNAPIQKKETPKPKPRKRIRVKQRTKQIG